MNLKGRISRRKLLTTAGLTALGAATAQRLVLPPERENRQRVLRIAHLTDIHVQPELGAADGMAAALEHAHNLQDRPDIIFQGGDAIMDALAADKARVQQQWRLWREVLDANLELPIVHAVGNHDVWGWSLEGAGVLRDALYGKAWALDMFGLERGYYSFDRAGWHFIVLDSNFPAEGGYTARLDDVQFEWLGGDVRATPPETPVCVLSHIPVLAACPFFDGDNEASGDWEVPGAWMHIDARRVKDLFKEHPNVRLALSGHIHLQDETHYLGVKYLCNGAVSGGWWNGPYQEFQPAYVTVDLYDDGSSERQVHPYGWKTRAGSRGGSRNFT